MFICCVNLLASYLKFLSDLPRLFQNVNVFDQGPVNSQIEAERGLNFPVNYATKCFPFKINANTVGTHIGISSSDAAT